MGNNLMIRMIKNKYFQEIFQSLFNFYVQIVFNVGSSDEETLKLVIFELYVFIAVYYILVIVTIINCGILDKEI